MSGTAEASALVGLLVAGDARVFRLLMDRYGRLLAVIAAGFRQPEWARTELVHDTLTRVWEARASLRQPGDLDAFVMQVARNLARDAERRGKVRRRVEDRDAAADEVPAAAEQSPEQRLLRDERVERVREFLAGESPEMRAVFEAYFVDELSGTEVAAARRLTPRAARRRLDRLKERASLSLERLFGRKV